MTGGSWEARMARRARSRRLAAARQEEPNFPHGVDVWGVMHTWDERGNPRVVRMYTTHPCPTCGHDDDEHLLATDLRCLMCGCERYR